MGAFSSMAGVCSRAPRTPLCAYRYFTNPMSAAYSRKQRRQMSRPYLRMRPRRELQTRLRAQAGTRSAWARRSEFARGTWQGAQDHAAVEGGGSGGWKGGGDSCDTRRALRARREGQSASAGGARAGGCDARRHLPLPVPVTPARTHVLAHVRSLSQGGGLCGAKGGMGWARRAPVTVAGGVVRGVGPPCVRHVFVVNVSVVRSSSHATLYVSTVNDHVALSELSQPSKNHVVIPI